MYKANCSALGAIMTNGRKAGELGETCKTEVRNAWIKDTFGRRPLAFSKEMKKGNECEEDSLTLFTKVTGQLVIKNELRLENEWIKGYPDATTKDAVIEIKTPWDLFTYAKADFDKGYEWQIRGYMMLTGLDHATLAYCLVNAPNSILSDELYRMQWSFKDGDSNPDYDIAADQLTKNLTFDDIPEKLRVKQFHIERDLLIEGQIKERIEQCREYYETLKLN